MPLFCLTSCGRRRPKAAPKDEQTAHEQGNEAPFTSPTVQTQQPSLVPYEISNVLSYIPAPLHQLPVGTVIAIPARRYATRSYAARPHTTHPHAAPSPSQPVVREIQAWLDATAGRYQDLVSQTQRGAQADGLAQQTSHPPRPPPSTPVRPYGAVVQDVQGWVEDTEIPPLARRSRRHRLPASQTRPDIAPRSSSVCSRTSRSSSTTGDAVELDRLSTAVVVGGQVQVRHEIDREEVSPATRQASRAVRNETQPMVSAGVAAQEARRSRNTMYGTTAPDFDSPPPPYPSASPPPPYRSLAGSPDPESSGPIVHHTVIVSHSQRRLLRTALVEAMHRIDERTGGARSGEQAGAARQRLQARLRDLSWRGTHTGL